MNSTENLPTLASIKPFILGEDLEIKRELQKVDSFLRKEIESTPDKSERKLEILFFAMVTKLRLFHIETPEMARLFGVFLSEMDRQIENISHESLGAENIMTGIRKKGLKQIILSQWGAINKRLNMLESKIHLNQMKAFLYVCEQYIHTLETYYKDLSMSTRVLELYIVRMDIKRNRYFFNREFGLFIGFSIFRSISNYGTSFGRLAVTCSLSVIFFGSIYWMADFFAPENVRMIASLTDYSSYFFNSLVTISGLGIDASPQTALQRIAMGINTIY